MYQILHKVFIEKTMKTCSVQFTAREKSLSEVKIQRGIFQRNAISPLLVIITMMPLNHLLRKYSAGYILNKSQEMVHHRMYMDSIKLFPKK